MVNNTNNMPNMRKNAPRQNVRMASDNTNRNNSSQARCAELMNAIMEASFYAQDLKLYLDTHPDDTRAVEMYNEANRQYKACLAAFEESFYPLTPLSAGQNGVWDWPEGVWPPRN